MAKSLPHPLPILMYHSVDTSCAPAYQRWTVSPSRFAAQMARLAELGCTVVTVTDLVKHMQAGTLPDRAVAVSFDDGMRDFARHALPVLLRHNFPATLFVTTAYVGETARWLAPLGEGDREMLNWDELAVLPKYGIELGAHTHTHPQLDLLTADEAEAEIHLSRQLLHHHTGHDITSFAYPHGYSTAEIRRRVAAMGFVAACRVADALSTVSETHFALSRIIVTEQTSDADLTRLVRGHNSRVTPPLESWKIRAWRHYRHLSQLLPRTHRNAA